ncbi:MAG: hypothetical protein WBP44_02265 [Gammaproteobacteria bacterium]|jgi:hypothetical protein
MTTILILLLIVGIVAGLIWMVRSRQPVGHRRTGLHKYVELEASDDPRAHLGGLEKLKNNPLFWGVEMGQPGCEAAMALLDQQYTFEEAPRLPLEGCTSAMCNCQFKGLKNRRTQHRRKFEERRVEVRFEMDKPDRRSHKNRRRVDSWNNHTH